MIGLARRDGTCLKRPLWLYFTPLGFSVDGVSSGVSKFILHIGDDFPSRALEA